MPMGKAKKETRMSIAAVGDLPLRAPLPAPVLPVESRAARESAGPEPSPFSRLVRELGHEVQRGETIVRGALASAGNGGLGPAELIALQAGVYRYSEAVDLASKLVDHATSALKTVVQGQ
jgi:hypothetical protein